MSTLSLHTQRTADLNNATRNAIIRLCVEAHQEPDFEHLFDYLPSNGLHVLAYLAERLVSHAVVTTRWMQPEGFPILKSAYVDAVATLPALQGRGYGSATLRYLADAIRSDYDIGGLQTDNQLHFYTQVGWEQWRGALAGRGENGELTYTPNETGVMILRLHRTPALNLDSLLTIEVSGRIW